MLTTSQPVGYTRFLAREAVTLARAGLEVTLVGLNEPSLNSTPGAVRLVPVAARRGTRKPLLLLEMLKIARELRADTYHCFDPWALAIGLWIKHRRPGVRLVYDSTELFPSIYRDRHALNPVVRAGLYALVRYLEYLATGRADVIIETNATRAGRFARRGRTAAIVPNYPVLDAVPEVTGERYPWLAYTGLISRHRGFDKLLRSFVDVVREIPEARLRVMGDFDPSDDISDWSRDYIKTAGLSGHVEFLGWLPYEEMFRALRPCAAGVILLQAERMNDFTGQPNKLFDFMAAGIAVIAGRLPEVTGVLESVGCGWTTDASDSKAISCTLREALGSLDECTMRGDRGRAAALASYNWSSAAGALLDVYRGFA